MAGTVEERLPGRAYVQRANGGETGRVAVANLERIVLRKSPDANVEESPDYIDIAEDADPVVLGAMRAMSGGERSLTPTEMREKALEILRAASYAELEAATGKG